MNHFYHLKWYKAQRLLIFFPNNFLSPFMALMFRMLFCCENLNSFLKVFLIFIKVNFLNIADNEFLRFKCFKTCLIKKISLACSELSENWIEFTLKHSDFFSARVFYLHLQKNFRLAEKKFWFWWLLLCLTIFPISCDTVINKSQKL